MIDTFGAGMYAVVFDETEPESVAGAVEAACAALLQIVINGDVARETETSGNHPPLISNYR